MSKNHTEMAVRILHQHRHHAHGNIPQYSTEDYDDIIHHIRSSEKAHLALSQISGLIPMVEAGEIPADDYVHLVKTAIQTYTPFEEKEDLRKMHY